MIKLVAVVLFIALLNGCSEGKREGGDSGPAAPKAGVSGFIPAGTDEEQVRQVVLRYNQLLAEGYRTLNMNALAEVATRDQAEKAYIHMAAIGEGEVRMLSSLKKIDFTSLKRATPDEFVVRTKEIWDFSYTDIKTGKESGRVENFLYEVTYTLKKDGGRWVIRDVVANAPDDRGGPAPVPLTGRTGAPAQLPPGHGKGTP